MKEIDKGVTVEKTVTMGETHYRKLLAAEAERDRLRDALAALVNLNDEWVPFGGEILQDRIVRTWDRARAALKGDTQ